MTKESAPGDANYVKGLVAADYQTPTSPVVIYGDPSNHRLMVSAIITGNDNGTTGTTSTVAGSASSVTLKVANTNRIRLTIVNDSTAVMYIKEGATASTSDYTWRLNSYDTVVIDDYTGIVDGIWASATGNARITEVV